MPAQDEVDIREYRPVLVSEKGSWQRWVIILLLALFLTVQVGNFLTARQSVDRSKDARPLLCGIARDDAIRDPAVAAAYDAAGCVEVFGALP